MPIFSADSQSNHLALPCTAAHEVDVDMAAAESPDQLHLECDAEPVQTPTSPYIPDLSAIPGNELRKLTEIIVVAVESDGELYAPIFRQLQIQPDKYRDFHNGVIRVIRNKHHAQVRRGSDASIRTSTDFLLRAFGCIIWNTKSEWLIDEKDLDEGEAKLVYLKGRNQTPDARFYPVLESLWRQMRNVMFTRRPPPTRRGRPASLAPTFTDDEGSYMGDTDTRPSSPMTALHSRARAAATKKVENLAAQVARRLPARDRRMGAEQTEEALVELVARLADIRANSDPHVFEELWQAQIMRVEELEGEDTNEEERRADEDDANTPMTAKTPRISHQNGTSRSNEPFMTSGLPTPRSFPISSPLPPTLPSLMSVYISVSKLPSSSTQSTSVSHTAAAPLTQAYHWASAPVEEHNFVSFFTGINYRGDVAPPTILG